LHTLAATSRTDGDRFPVFPAAVVAALRPLPQIIASQPLAVDFPILVYAFVTPGRSGDSVLGAYSPSREAAVGGSPGAAPDSLLATLALLLATTSRDRILAGLYFLLRPFVLIGVDVDRVAARIWLTLHYAEQTGSRRSGDGANKCKAALHGSGQEMTSIQLQIGRLSRWITRHYCALPGVRAVAGSGAGATLKYGHL